MLLNGENSCVDRVEQDIHCRYMATSNTRRSAMEKRTVIRMLYRLCSFPRPRAKDSRNISSISVLRTYRESMYHICLENAHKHAKKNSPGRASFRGNLATSKVDSSAPSLSRGDIRYRKTEIEDSGAVDEGACWKESSSSRSSSDENPKLAESMSSVCSWSLTSMRAASESNSFEGERGPSSKESEREGGQEVMGCSNEVDMVGE